MSYKEVNPDIIQALKERGFTSCEMVLLEPDNPTQAKIEIIPGNEELPKFGIISLTNRDIYEYISEPDVMAKYVVDEVYLVYASTPKLH